MKNNKRLLIAIFVFGVVVVSFGIYFFYDMHFKGVDSTEKKDPNDKKDSEKINIVELKSVYETKNELYHLTAGYYIELSDGDIINVVNQEGTITQQLTEEISYSTSRLVFGNGVEVKNDGLGIDGNYYILSDDYEKNKKLYRLDEGKLVLQEEFEFEDTLVVPLFKFDNAKPILLGFIFYDNTKDDSYAMRDEIYSVQELKMINTNSYHIESALEFNTDFGPYLTRTENDIIVVDGKTKKYTLMDINGNVKEFNYDKISYAGSVELTTDLYIFTKNKKSGLMNSTGKVLLEAKYDFIDTFDTHAIVVLNNKMALVNYENYSVGEFVMNYNTNKYSIDSTKVSDYTLVINNEWDPDAEINYKHNDLYVFKKGELINTIDQYIAIFVNDYKLFDNQILSLVTYNKNGEIIFYDQELNVLKKLQEDRFKNSYVWISDEQLIIDVDGDVICLNLTTFLEEKSVFRTRYITHYGDFTVTHKDGTDTLRYKNIVLKVVSDNLNVYDNTVLQNKYKGTYIIYKIIFND